MLGIEIFRWPIDWSNSVNGSWDFDLRELQLGFGPELIDAQQNYIVNGFEFETTVRDSEIDDINSFLDSLQGRTNPFWLIGPLMEFKIRAGSSLSEFIIYDQLATDTWQLEVGSYIALTSRNEENQYRKITSIVDNLDGTETVTLTQATENAVDSEWMVFPLYMVRMADDTENVEVMAERCQRRSFKVVELPNDYALLDSGLNLALKPVYLYRFIAPFPEGDILWHFTSHPVDLTIEASYLQSSSSSADATSSSSGSSFSSVNSTLSNSSESPSSASSEGDGYPVTIISASFTTVEVTGPTLVGIEENHFRNGTLVYDLFAVPITVPIVWSRAAIGDGIRIIILSTGYPFPALPIPGTLFVDTSTADIDGGSESSSSATSDSSATSANSSSSSEEASTTWLAVGIEHDRLSRSMTLGGTVTIKADYDTVEPLRLLYPMRMHIPLIVEILKTDTNLIEPEIVFSGLITKPSLTGRTISVVASEWGDVMTQKVPGFYIQRECNYRVFSEGTCRADITLFQKSVLITYSNGGRSCIISDASLSGLAANYFALGRLVFGTGINKRVIFITSSTAPSGNAITLSLSSVITDELPIEAIAIPGCDGLRATCGGTFGNIINFGGAATPKENLSLVAIKTDEQTGGKK